MKHILLPLVLVSLAACSSGAPVQREAVVSGASFASVQGEARLNVRTFLPSEDGERREVLGASCRLETSLYSLDFQTPVRLKLPNFGPQSPELSITCNANELSGTARAEIRTNWDRPPGAFGYAGYGPYGRRGFYGGWPYGGFGYPVSAVPVSTYPDIDVILR
ncbi:MAG: hypothetical protein AAGG56_16735 [Pseudomonadota bacterium]